MSLEHFVVPDSEEELKGRHTHERERKTERIVKITEKILNL